MHANRRIDWGFLGFALWVNTPLIAVFAFAAFVDLCLDGVR